MSKERLEAEVVVTIDQPSLKQSEQEMKRLQSPEAIKMAIDLGALKRQLEVMKGALREAMKVGDVDLTNRIGGQIEILKKQITGLNRELTNFVRTGDKELSVLGKLFRQVGIDVNSGLGKALLQATEGISNFASKGLLLAGGGAIALGLYKLGTQAIFLGDKLEQASLSFSVMLGSGERAKQLLSDLTEFSKKTPFELQGIRDSAKQLLAFGIDANSIVGTLKVLGDVAAGTGTPLEQIAYAYGQVRTANQLYGTELRQFMNAGVPILSELARMYGVTESAAKKMVEDGKVGFNDVQQAFVNMTGKGGKFFNLMEVQSTTLTGKISNLKDSFNSFLEQIGTALIPFAKLFIDTLAFLFNGMKQTFQRMQIVTTIATASMIDAWYSVADVFNAVVIFLKKFGVIWLSSFRQFGDNVFTLIENVGIAFDNMPAYIQGGLNKALESINGFVNTAGSMLNDVASFFGKEGGLVGKANFRLDFAGPVKAFKDYSSAISDAGVTQALALDVQRQQQKDHTAELKKINDETLQDYIINAGNFETQSRKLNTNLAKVADDGRKKASKAARDAENEKKKIYEDSIKFQKKVFENAIKLREEDLKTTEDYISKLKDAVKEITDLENEIAGVEKDASQKTLAAAGDRYRELLEGQKKAKEELQKALQETDQSMYVVNPQFQKNLDEIQAQIKEIESSGLLDQNTLAKEQQRASLSSDGQARFDFQDKLGQIAIDKANKEAELQAKKTDIESKLGLSKYQAEQELIIQEKRKSANEQALSKYRDIIALIDKGITDNTQKEIDKRMAMYAQEEQRLLRLIELRMQAGYAIGAISAPAASSTTNNTANVTVQANVANNVDIDNLARTLSRRITLGEKGINK